MEDPNPNGNGRRQPVEINVQARLCRGNRFHGVGDLITYRSTLWVVKGVYLGVTRSGDREPYYILGATAAADTPEEIVE